MSVFGIKYGEQQKIAPHIRNDATEWRHCMLSKMRFISNANKNTTTELFLLIACFAQAEKLLCCICIA